MMGQPSAPAGRLLRRGDAVLVVIDVQERLLPHVVAADEVVANIVRLLRFARIVGLPVLVTEQRKLGPTVDEVRTELGDAPVIEKTQFGSLACDGFADALRSCGRQALILVGLEAHICVTQTALQALPEYLVHVVSDAVSARSPDNKAIALQRMAQSGAVITSTEMLMYEVLAQAGTAEFRACLELVKGG